MQSMSVIGNGFIGFLQKINGAETEIIDLKSIYATDLVLSHPFISLPVPLGTFSSDSQYGLAERLRCYLNSFVLRPCTIFILPSHCSLHHSYKMPPSATPRSITNAREVANTPSYSASRVTNHRNREDSSLLPSTESGRVLRLPQSIINAREVANMPLYSASPVTNHRNRDASSLSPSTESGHFLPGIPCSITSAREVANIPLYSASRITNTNHRNRDDSLPRSTESGRVLPGLPRPITNAREIANIPLYSSSHVTNHLIRDNSSLPRSTQSGHVLRLPRSITSAREVANHCNHNNSSLPRSTESGRILLGLIRSIDEAESERTTLVSTLDTRSPSAITTARSSSTEVRSHFSDATRGQVVTSRMPPARGVANTPLVSAFQDAGHPSSDLHDPSTRRSTAAGRCLLELIHSLDNAEHDGARASGNRSTSTITITRTSQFASVITTTGSSGTVFTSRFNDSTHGQVVTSQMSPSHPVTNTGSVTNMPSASHVFDYPSPDNVNHSSLQRSTAAGRLLLELIHSSDDAESEVSTQGGPLGSRTTSAIPTGSRNSSTRSTTNSEVIADTSDRSQIASGAADPSFDTSTTHANDEVSHEKDDEDVLLETVGNANPITDFMC
ncbi:hypothetical protein F5878DRAFT_666618 [Lentinula raphanica]|uniref:Uncharacterized protein n=1 Tax=Lentinula raphanica TaxID=153919 RepID=A0AA38NXD4_9AGAR|nr:hypothetical protein F5878DRAFT_666618 [Lentinula raphanica]